MDRYEFLAYLHDSCQVAKSGAFAKHAPATGIPNAVVAIGEQLRRIARQVPGPEKIDQIRRTDEARAAYKRCTEQLKHVDRVRTAQEHAREIAERREAQRRLAIAEVDAKIAELESQKQQIVDGGLW